MYRKIKILLAEAKKVFEKNPSLGNISDYEQALKKHWVSYSEFAHQFEFYKKTEAERNECVSRLRMAYFYWRNTPSAAKSVFRNKTKLKV